MLEEEENDEDEEDEKEELLMEMSAESLQCPFKVVVVVVSFLELLLLFSIVLILD